MNSSWMYRWYDTVGPKMEGSPSEVGPAHAVSEAASAEAHPDDHFSDDEQETELDALQHLPPEERRKALRRLRNRESARRVRARRLAEMSQMGTTLQSLQDENSTLKAHVNKLQSHIQSMTLKVYEVTSKYEAAVAEAAQLRAELNRYRRPSVPGDSSFLMGATAATAAQTANGPNSAPLNQLSPFISPMEIGGGGLGAQSCLSPSHVQLRSSSPMEMQRQRQAIEEVVMLLKEHKRRHHPGQDRSGNSEIGSNGAGAAGSGGACNVTNHQSPGSDTAMPGGSGTGGPLGDLAAGVLATNNSTTANNNNGLMFNVGSMSRFMGAAGTGAVGASGLGSGSGGRSSQSEVLTGSVQHSQLMAQVQARMAATAAAAAESAASALPCTGNGGGLQMTGHGSGANALGSGMSGVGPVAAAPGFGGQHQQHHHRSASWALDRGTAPCVTSAQNVVPMHPTWQMNAGAGAGTVDGGLMMRPEDFAEDLMFLDDYVPQDL
ncbi:hypothetical protein VOLCADRAFT_95062 [Volvox carteri f. nagariensis]|uniref:BZIP domain-containing protein n=1 Tax=Volvox carteri f. nagariensis TaxID=3068 RepID=D8U6H6_VOLCA|nr:uncharacterized protein VOLCADRAFT_95062 [Volvox carteri f. nagariensis]EFJ44714.1 hypothetical protein VOLCADRAFT_95062 [Volvox carteri f. nagariensis]|eukprot:XP_002954290.1 hypothetical protein VOLCADRAFT_95062 [Volvox carteri f. nagariensis]